MATPNEKSREYLQGKIRGLELINDALFVALTSQMPDLPESINLRVIIAGIMRRAIVNFEISDPELADSQFGNGARDALVQFELKMFS